jgi:hypothetical protein
MRDVISRVRREQRELKLFGYSNGGPTEVLVAEMLEQLLDDTEAVGNG